MKHVLALICFVLLCFVQAAKADTWAPPETRVYVAADGSARLTVVPNLCDEAVVGLEAAHQCAATANHKAAYGTLESRAANQGWLLLWQGELTNEVAPAEVLVAPGGAYFVTLDNWYTAGTGDNAVVIYRADGTIVRRMGLRDFLSKKHVDAMPQSFSSYLWNPSYLISNDHSELVLEVAVPFVNYDPFGPTVTVHIDLQTGSVKPLSTQDVTRIETGWREVAEADEAYRQFMTQPLVAPNHISASAWLANNLSTEELWKAYLAEAVSRLQPPRVPGQSRPASDEDHSSEVPSYVEDLLLLTPDERGYLDSEKAMKARLRPTHLDNGQGLALASTDEANLVKVLQRVAAKLTPGALEGRYIYLAISKRGWEEVSGPLTNSGASLRHIDTDAAIPQHTGLLEYMEQNWSRQ